MQSVLGSEHRQSQNSCSSVPCALWPVDLKLTHLDWNPEATLIHFQGQYLTICDLDYNILQGEIQNVPKTKAAVDIGEFCLVEDLTSARWYRGRVQNRKEDLFDVFLIDRGNVLSVDIANISSCSNDLFILPPKIVCGFLANVLLLQSCSHSVVEEYFSSLIGRDVTGYIQALLPHKVLLLEAPDINVDFVRHGFGRHVDTATFLLLVEMLTEFPLKQYVEQVPDLLIEKPRGQEFCFKPSGLQGYEDILSFCGPRLSCGTRAKVRVTAAVNPGLFYCQMVSMETELWEMSKKLAAVCEYRTKECGQKTPENLGLLCSVKGKDGKWYRGFVQFLPVNSQVRVLFIDYGFFESVKVENVHRLPPDFDSTPIMAFPCSLLCLSDQDEAVKAEQLSFLKAGLLGRVLDVEIKSFDKQQHLYSIAVVSAEDNHVKELEPVQELPRIKSQSVFETEELSPQGGYLYYETIMCEAFGKTLKTEEVRVDSVFVGYVEHVQNPHRFWIRTQKRNGDFEEMMREMADHFSEMKMDEDVLLNPELGTLCCAVYEEDMHFYRGVVTDTLEHGAEVLFIDFGNIEKVPHMLIKKIPKTFASKSAFAFCCSLANVIPLGDVWTSTTGDFFRRTVSNKALLVRVVQMKKNKLVVDLYEMGSDNNQSISELLISANQAEHWNNIPVDKNSWGPEVCNSLKGFVHDGTRGLRCEVVSQLNVKNKGLCNVVDLYDTQTQQSSMTNVLRVQGLAREATIPTKQLSAVIPESFVFSSHDISPGNEEQVYVTYVSSQWEVYCHLERNTDVIEELERKISEESEKMMQASTRAVVRKMCLAKYFDGKWYRGLAHPVQSPLHLSVYFVDYGNTNISEKTHVMYIPRHSTDLLYTPMQAVRCSLASVSKEELYADAKKWLHDEVLNKKVRALVVGKNEDGSFDVVLFDGDVNINEKVNELILSLLPKPKTVGSVDMSSAKTKHKTLHTRNAKMSVKHTNANRGVAVGSVPHGKKNTKVQGIAQSKNAKVKQQNEDGTKRCVSVKPQKNSQLTQQRDTNTKSEPPQYTKDTEIPQLLCLPDIKVSKGFRAKCFVSHIESVNSFFLQLSEDEAALLKMGEDLNSGIFKKTTAPLRINDLVLAEYEEDGALYRCAVKDREGSSSFKVEFVDYGNSAVIGMEKIYSIPKEYLSQPRFSIPCSLLDTSTYDSDTSFTDAVMDKPLVVDFVRQCGTQWEVTVEILDGVGLPASLESSTETEKEEEPSASSPEKEESVRSCQPNCVREEVAKNETAKERMMPTVDKPPPPTALSRKLNVKICRSLRRRPIRNKCYSQKNPRKIKAKSDRTDGIIPLTVQAKDTENCRVLSVLSNSNFYVRLNRTSDALAALESRIADNLHKYEVVAEEEVRRGFKCLVQVHKDEQWHRAAVQHVCQGKCQVLLLDHGTTEEIPSCSIRRQNSNLANVPNFAVKCKMNCFGFSEGEGAHKSWCETLKPMIGKEVKLVFVCYSEADQLWSVEIIMNELFLILPITTSLQRDEETIPPPAETTNDRRWDTSRPQQLVFAPIDTDKAYSGFAAAVTTPFEFCVVLEDLLLVMSEVSLMLDDLPEQMSPLPEANLVPGTCCLLKSDTKNKWCRAEIVHFDPTAVLNLVDYGHYECVPYENCSQLKRLPVELTSQPKVTYPCILRGVKPVRADGQWTDEAAVFFQQCLCQKNLQIFFREFVSNTHWKVDVLADGVHVAKELVDAGHASYIDVMLGLRFQEQSPRKAASHNPGSEEERGEEGVASDRKSRLSVESTDEAEEKIQRSGECFLM
ncbi:tudor domain-containing protein 15 [Morone saxatilis]|uniref:tudor domain-containing protein 15 n=1 Tax=Morone saxatilis TaxID=34816 RepID=UPI0015E1C051|nr:tudor domain-containing protein 15 [Morone saxatilis]